jgi:hypothetical protein
VAPDRVLILPERPLEQPGPSARRRGARRDSPGPSRVAGVGAELPDVRYPCCGGPPQTNHARSRGDGRASLHSRYARHDGTVLGLLASGHDADGILAAYPYLEKDDVQAALTYAAWRAEEVELPLT